MFKVLCTLLEFSKKINDDLIFTKFFNVLIFLFSFEGRNPTKKNFSELKPEATKAVIIALGPGIGIIGRFSFNAKTTNSYPGSYIRGVPASLINATVLPSLIFLINFINFSSGVKSWCEISLPLIL